MKDETSSEIGDEWRKELIWAHIESGLYDSGGYLNSPQICKIMAVTMGLRLCYILLCLGTGV